jgi:phosphate ABC transporter phosphate-binding protein
MTLHRAVRLLAAVTVGAIPALVGSVPANAAAHALIQGSGSSWSSNAVNQWIADVQPSGLQVVFTANGSAQGRKDFAFKTTDFAVSDIGYQGHDPVTNENDTSLGRAYSYLPIVAGGTSFPYQIRVGGQLVRNLRLSGETLAKIFTNKITNWNDPEVTQDNNGHALPSIPVIPVVHSEGSGSTAQFTTFLDSQYPSLWRPYFGASGMTEYYPRQGDQIAQNGSDGVMNFISSASANGAIGYDEYSYALAKDYPVAKVENKGGYFTLPTQYNVAVALTKAQINYDKSSPNYLLQKLDGVFTDTDPRTYPLSSYSYMIIPTAADDSKMTTAKRQTEADFLYYSICQGQKEMGPIGYSPLPINLVQAGFQQTAKFHDADSGVDLSKENVTTCDNPTFVSGQPKRNYLAEIAPKPPTCDKAGQGPCTGNEGAVLGNPTSSGKAPTSTGGSGKPASGNNGSTGTTTGGTGTTPGAGGGAGATVAAGTGGAAGTAIDPTTGQVIATNPTATGSTGGVVVASPTEIPDSSSSSGLAVLAAALLLGAIVAPPLTARWLRSRRPVELP